jgi:hypothetical protein
MLKNPELTTNPPSPSDPELYEKLTDISIPSTMFALIVTL